VTRRTSAEALVAIIASDRISESKRAVYKYLFDRGPCTRNELDQALGEGSPNPTYSRRLTELEAMGLVARVGERRCMVTDFKADLWDVTDTLPSDRAPARRAPLKRRVETLLAAVKAEVQGPRAQVFPENVLTRVRELVDQFEREQQKEDAA
jgi:hypothetical protein